MINGKRIAVVMPAYNAEKTLEQTVRELSDVVFGPLHVNTNVILASAMTVVLTLPVSLALLAMVVFYLWAYLRSVSRLRPAPQEVNDMEPVSK